jgi:hypothetical protein
MPRRSRDRRTNPLATLARTLDRVTGDGSCVALAAPLLGGVLMHCQRPCAMCAALDAEVAALQPERDAAREAYALAHPETRKPPAPELGLDEEEEEEA